MKREFNVEVKNGSLRIFLDGNNYHCILSDLYLSENPIKKALEFNFEQDVYNDLDELQQFEYDKVNNEIKESWKEV